MPPDTGLMLDERQLNDTDTDIIDFMLSHGDRVTAHWIASETEHSRTYVAQRLKRLTEHGHVEKPHRGLYDLIDDPREDSADD
jgi:uncharacterized membrane protein